MDSFSGTMGAVEMLEEFNALGFKPNRPLSGATRQKLFDKMETGATHALKKLYSFCNGGHASKVGCRFYRLQESIELALHYSEYFNAFATFPIAVHEDMGSDPCCVMLTGPLRGYVYWHPHDSLPKLFAPNIKSFLRALTKWIGNPRGIEEIDLVYPKTLSKKERADYEKALDFATALEGKIHEWNFLRDIALSMPSEGRGEAFVQRCVECLRRNGFQVEKDGYYLVLGKRKRKFHVKYYEKERDRPDFESFFVNRLLAIGVRKQ